MTMSVVLMKCCAHTLRAWNIQYKLALLPLSHAWVILLSLIAKFRGFAVIFMGCLGMILHCPRRYLMTRILFLLLVRLPTVLMRWRLVLPNFVHPNL